MVEFILFDAVPLLQNNTDKRRASPADSLVSCFKVLNIARFCVLSLYIPISETPYILHFNEKVNLITTAVTRGQEQY